MATGLIASFAGLPTITGLAGFWTACFPFDTGLVFVCSLA